MLYNISNHPSTAWDESQLAAARQLSGGVIDLTFPVVLPQLTSDDVNELAQGYAESVSMLIDPKVDVVHVMGEMTFCYALVHELQKLGIRCFASTTTRQVSYNDQGEKVSLFHFVTFREYTAY